MILINIPIILRKKRKNWIEMQLKCKKPPITDKNITKMHINWKRKLYKNTKTTRQKERNVLQYIHNKRAFTKVTI